MNALTFDTLKLARKLEAAGFSPEQAAGASAALAETLGEVSGVAGKEDVLRLEAKIEATKAEITAEAHRARACDPGSIQRDTPLLGCGFGDTRPSAMLAR